MWLFSQPDTDSSGPLVEHVYTDGLGSGVSGDRLQTFKVLDHRITAIPLTGALRTRQGLA